MADLRHVGLADAVACAGRLRSSTSGATSMEGAASAVVASLRAFFVDPDTGRSQLVLARMFSTELLSDLPADLQTVAGGLLAGDAAADLRCLTLLGTDGDLPTWSDRRLSVAHRAVPLPSAEAVRRAPMVAALVSELGLELDTVLSGRPVPADTDFGVFLVERAQASRRVPDQRFVHEHEVASVLGFGAQLPSGQVFAVVLFTRVPVQREVADLFRILAVSTQLAMLEFAGAPLFDDQPGRMVDGVEMTLARLEALERLLDVHEAIAAEQTGRLEQSVRRLRAQDERLRREADIIETLHRVGRLLSAELELEPLIRLATDAVVEVTGAEFGAFFYDARDGDPTYLLHTVAGVERSPLERFAMPRTTPLLAPTLGGAGIVRSDDISGDPRYDIAPPFEGMPLADLPLRSYLAVPVVTKDGRVEGGLLLGHAAAGVFDDRAERLVVGIAAQTAAGLDNSRLYLRERETALLLQRQLLPHELPSVATLEASHRYLPGAAGVEVGGDWYDLIDLGAGRAALVIGDVMGRGVRAAATMGQLRTAIRALATLDLAPAQVLTQLNRMVLQLTDEQIVTCVYAVFDSRDGSLVLANAGHPPPAVVAADGMVTTVPTALDPPLGVAPTAYGQHQMHLGFGDSLLLYTDGLVESRQRSADEGVGELCALLELEAPGLLQRGDPESLLDLLLGRLTQGSEHDDDVALLLVQTT